MGHERGAFIVSALGLVVFLVKCSDDRAFPLLWDLSPAPDEGDGSVKLQEDDAIRF